MIQAYESPRSRLARSVVQYLSESKTYPYAILKGVSRDEAFDVLDIDLEIELDQRRRVPICPSEPIRIIFMANDDSWPPRVLSTRAEFPIGLVHTNLDRDGNGGLCLCIWEEGWSDLAASLTGQSLIERIRAWFSAMAAGTLHADAQFLEPLIHTSSNTLIIPPGEAHGPWFIDMARMHGSSYVLSVTSTKPAEPVLADGFAVYSPRLPSQVHRGLARTPYDLASLQRLCLDLEFDLVEELAAWLLQSEQLSKAADRLPLLILTVPKRRDIEEADEKPEVWCYTLSGTVADLGEALDLTITEAGVTTPKLLGDLSKADLSSIRMDPWRVVQRLDRSAARAFAGSCRAQDTPLLGIGTGAIGSNVAMIATRSGLGPWVLVDGDLTLPHNTVRQVQRNVAVGWPKAQILQFELDGVLAEGGNSSIPVNVFYPGNDQAALDRALHEAEVAIDFSASPAVLGWLADQAVNRAASAFFGPDGSDLVVLSEDPARAIKLDEIEAQYFWAVATEAALNNHLRAARMDRIRYANACQDLSRPLPPWQVHTLCGLAAGRLAQLLDEGDASLRVWRLEPDSGSVDVVVIAVHKVSRFQTGDARLAVSDEVVQTMRMHRAQAGPNETGGVLLGTFDLVRNVVHIVAALPAPPDSKQAPTYFIRGIKDLKPLIEQLGEASAGRLHYIGEWHSHPAGAPARPSDDDENVFAHLKAHIGPVGSPYVMAICGERDTWFRAGWQERGIVHGVIAHE
ncbi:Mov34/MPN/PAD-1 family protein [Stutzerimonas nitrititolerans]|uniref:Mov34/MPN/PAD-1 family protein n=1 Tax=Stutzerimonas nitrititolerans TaxID=2482751 RepID=UPI0028A82228|nr:Mov34/MPN/PAD-1 family protein [Stutzerimonas nitrititolerans]